MNQPLPPIPRPIRSYVLRQGRISHAQQRAYDSLLPRFGIPYQAASFDPGQSFGRSAPTVLEIGFGMGESTAQIAQSRPDLDFIGVEVHTPGVGSLLKQIEESGLSNVRVIQHDAVEVLQHMIGENTLAGAHIFFPDPWPKLRHHKRRLIQPGFVRLIASRLQPGGYLHAATDWEAYAEHILATLSQEPLLENTADSYALRPAYRPLTKFEQRGLKLGHGVWDIVFRKRASP
ncbi:MAG: tRNA (guanosine(46)-N7)-methyltransferase TrmB [Betaproteobacteria bacterium RBG_16_58_11]|nr:MAG: tRNA (guanosine(46)-N7)-methyltransferase TrmB [Betaproteobacteria bacterium RBG_16_58_11]OFZ99670.1 MAG: tRNA (guanosine(46)-N7)-methyltransferase TrmB [Betaproteobacteria bacterium RBG_19FT_COMBO_58_11]